eukprot:SAG22_NODE_958_length_6301_cov_4.995324_10_plen_124_part_00
MLTLAPPLKRFPPVCCILDFLSTQPEAVGDPDKLRIQVSCKALSFCCASTVFLSKAVPFHAVRLSRTVAAERQDDAGLQYQRPGARIAAQGLPVCCRCRVALPARLSVYPLNLSNSVWAALAS